MTIICFNLGGVDAFVGGVDAGAGHVGGAPQDDLSVGGGGWLAHESTTSRKSCASRPGKGPGCSSFRTIPGATVRIVLLAVCTRITPKGVGAGPAEGRLP